MIMDTGDIAIITVQTLGAYRKNIATLPRKIELYMDWSIDVEQIKATSNQREIIEKETTKI
eukprot:m.134976 g.134976  ORF g.134976 m.134976 type:complete len:61 (+) comp29768_c1_seq7:484-666(+)